ncbi:hypothetical protein [Carboxylicivirga sp. N1Y90]|uniref:hypothetical protein n=1 Tax=Carboxylicivirga fragile TaxID=3417571 RepID=UPI003D34E352|nr:hypothetical protein [Marinilabiliaceae bacterium N1Y90]
MYFERKLKPAPFPKELLVPITVLPGFLLVLKMVGFSAAYLFLLPLFVVVAIINILTYERTKNIGYLLIVVAMSLMTVMSILVVMYGRAAPKPIMAVIIVMLVMTFPFIFYMMFTKRLKWRKREMLELAARHVNEADSGYTDRPFPAGHIDFTRAQLDAFVDFLRVKMIAIPIFENGSFHLVMNTDYGFVLGFNNSFIDKTHVTIDSEGNVLVHICKGDYLLYREDFSYDKICESMGKTIIDFFEFYHKGEYQRIIDILNNMNLNIITEG